MSSTIVQSIYNVMVIAAPPLMFGAAGAIGGLAFEYANESFFHRQKWLIPTAGAFGGMAAGVLYGWKGTK